jgi:hypothetical protein
VFVDFQQYVASESREWRFAREDARRSCLGPANFDLLVLSCRNQNSSGARGFSIFDFALGSPVVASRCWRIGYNLIEIEKPSVVRHNSFLLFGRFSIVVGFSRLQCEVERTKFDVYRSYFDRWCAG